MQTPYAHLVGSASSLDQENLQALIDDLQLMYNERETSPLLDNDHLDELEGQALDQAYHAQPGAEPEFLMIEDGEFDYSPVSRQDLLEQAGRLLDKAGSWDILGDALFVENGKWYVVSVGAAIGEANPAWLKDRLQYLSDEIGSDQPEYRAIMAKLEGLKDA